MAVNNTTNSYANMEFPLSIKRQDAFSLDAYAVWGSLDEATTYAASNPTAYVGQILSVVVDGESTVYQIKDTSGTLETLAGGDAVATATDDEVSAMIDEVFGATT